MGVDQNLKTGVPQTHDLKCQTGDKCLVKRALELHRFYSQALIEYVKLQNTYGERLEMADFVKNVAKMAAHTKSIKESDVWGNLRTSAAGGAATSWETTWLCKDITDMVAKFTAGKAKVEDRAAVLTEFISKEVFQKHLVKFHSKALSAQDVQDYYQVTLPPDESADTPRFREMDHLLALLTVNLSMSDLGLEFLENLTDDKWLENKMAFKDMWGYLKKVNSCVEPISKVVNNFAPVINLKINQLIELGKVATIQDILKDPDLKRHFDFLDKKFGIKISEFLDQKAQIYGEGAKKAARSARYRSDWKTTVKNWQDIKHPDYDAKYKLYKTKESAQFKLDGLWIGLTIDSIALAISVVNLFSDLKKAKWTDVLTTAGSLLSLAKTISGGLEARQALLATIGNDGTIVFTSQQTFYKWFGRSMGLIGGVVTAIVSIAKAIDGWNNKDWDVVVLNCAAAAIGLTGGVAAICGASTLGGVTAVLGLVLAVVSAYVLDAPIIDYLEKVAWGEDALVPVKDTVREYYKRLFKIEVKFIVAEGDINYSYIRIESELLSNTTPVFVEILDPGNKPLGDKMAVYPGMKKVNGAGSVQKDAAGWDFAWPTQGKRVKILNYWEIWTDIKRGDELKYTIRVGIDPSNDITMPIDKMVRNDNVTCEFPGPQVPILYKNSGLAAGYQPFSPGMTMPSGKLTCKLSSTNGLLRKFVYTKYAGNSSIKIVAEKDVVGFNPVLFSTQQPVRHAEPDSLGIVMTPVDIQLPNPSGGEEYSVILSTELVDSGGVRRGNDSTTFKVV